MGNPPHRSEIQIVSLFRSRARIWCPAVLLVAVPNAAKRTRWQAMQAQREGMAKGFPDMMALAPGGMIAFLEFKAKAGRLSESQKEWMDRLGGPYGFPVGVFCDPDDALAFLRHHSFPFLDQRVARPIGEIIEPIVSGLLDRLEIVP